MDWVKGHSDDENNKRADKAAVQGALSPYRIKGSNSWVRKPFFKKAKRFKSKE
jgi:ribonuclease H